MANVKRSEVITRVRKLLADPGVAFANEDLNRWFKDGVHQAAFTKPSITSKEVVLQITGNDIMQDINSGGNNYLRLIKIFCQCNAQGALTSGACAVTPIKEEDLAAIDPEYLNNSGSELLHYFWNEQTPTLYGIYRYLNGGVTYVKALVADTPQFTGDEDEYGNSSDYEAVIPEMYTPALTDYVLYRCYSHDSEGMQNFDRANHHYLLFTGAITGKMRLDLLMRPDKGRGRAVDIDIQNDLNQANQVFN